MYLNKNQRFITLEEYNNAKAYLFGEVDTLLLQGWIDSCGFTFPKRSNFMSIEKAKAMKMMCLYVPKSENSYGIQVREIKSEEHLKELLKILPLVFVEGRVPSPSITYVLNFYVPLELKIEDLF